MTVHPLNNSKLKKLSIVVDSFVVSEIKSGLSHIYDPRNTVHTLILSMLDYMFCVPFVPMSFSTKNFYVLQCQGMCQLTYVLKLACHTMSMDRGGFRLKLELELLSDLKA